MKEVTQFRPEHFALNLADPLAMAQWYTKHLRMTVVRQSGPPTHTTFFADAGKNIMLELFCNKNFPMLDLRQVNHMALHLAFMAEDIAATRDALLAAGATVVDDITQIPNGDTVLMMRDPWGLPIQFVKRVDPMLV